MTRAIVVSQSNWQILVEHAYHVMISTWTSKYYITVLCVFELLSYYGIIYHDVKFMLKGENYLTADV